MSKMISLDTIEKAKFVFEDSEYQRGWNAALEALQRFAKLQEVDTDGQNTKQDHRRAD